MFKDANVTKARKESVPTATNILIMHSQWEAYMHLEEAAHANYKNLEELWLIPQK